MLSKELQEFYFSIKDRIKQRLLDFKAVPKSDYFYELCYCLLTPQSSARNAEAVVSELKKSNFQQLRFNPVQILSDKQHYIRFHNVKARRLLEIEFYFSELLHILDSKRSAAEKRLWLLENINGFGMKECSHFLRNIGYCGLTILDRHILKNLVKLEIYDSVPKVASVKDYLSAESKFLSFAENCSIAVDELDLLFWSYETGEILK